MDFCNVSNIVGGLLHVAQPAKGPTRRRVGGIVQNDERPRHAVETVRSPDHPRGVVHDTLGIIPCQQAIFISTFIFRNHKNIIP